MGVVDDRVDGAAVGLGGGRDDAAGAGVQTIEKKHPDRRIDGCAGVIDQQVVVTGDAPIVETTQSSVAGVVEEKRITDLPLNGRDFTQLIAVAPGYGGYAVGGFGSLNGTRPNQMNW